MIVGALADISDRYDALFCDLWGCLHDGVRAFPDAVAALQAYLGRGGQVVLVTNSPRPSPGVAVQLGALGVPRDAWDAVASSGDAAQTALAEGAVGQRVHHVGPERDLPFFTDLPADAPAASIERVPLDQAEGIVCTGLADDRTETPEDYRLTIARGVHAGLPMLCANPDIVVDVGDQRIYCAGALAQAYEEAGGRALYFGKPHPPIYALARKRLGGDIPDDRILAIGDGPKTDVLGAQQEGLDCLFVTGGLAREATATRRDPDADKLAAVLQDAQVGTTHAIGYLR